MNDRTGREIVLVNRAPVLTLWAAVVAERLGFEREAALSLGKALAGLNAQSKGRRLGIFKPAERPEGMPPRKAKAGEEFRIEILGREVPAKATPEGIRAVAADRLIDPSGVSRYLEEKFGASLGAVERAMKALAESFRPGELAGLAFSLYERFRPRIPAGVKGWGVKGELSLDVIRSLQKKA